MNKNNMLRPLGLALMMLGAAPSFAQIAVPPGSDAGALQQRRIEEERRREEEERLKRKPVTEPLQRAPAGKAADKPAAPGTVSFLVKAFRFSASAIFTPRELEIMVENYEGKRVTFADLQRLVEHINGEYRKRGVVTAQAVLPPQDITTGVIQIQLIEGRVGAVQLRGNATTNDSYILDRLSLPAGKLMDLEAFERDLKRFNRSNDIQLRAELKPGAFAGATEVILEAIEPPRHNVRFTLDNLGSKSTGQWRSGLAYTNRSLLGYRDDLTLSGTFAEGLKSYSISYGVPVNTLGGRVTVAAYRDQTDIKNGPLAPLAITGESTTLQLTVRQPVVLTDTAQIDAVASVKQRDSQTKSSGVILQDNRNEDFSVGGEFNLADERGSWGGSLNAAFGSAESRVTGVTNNPIIARGSLRRVQRIAQGWSARGSFQFQRSPDNQLSSGEQFVIGGDGSVRGYPVGAYAGDQGYSASVELHHPVGQWGASESPYALQATGFLFADYGRVSPYRPPGSVLRSHEEISSVGWGLHYAIGKRLSGRVVLAHALNNLPQDASRNAVHFQLVAQLQ